ncbi:MAG: glycosyltransferase [Lactobacillales bacterium]|jgi:glycosyltransferase involved in cell wall biosynthesis|nr:glycosyltransferase [Lactobacillales bacterium]
MVKVSVIMPVYNTDTNHLKEAIDSVLNQTFQDFELLIVDDSSTNKNTIKTLKSYQNEKIKVLSTSINSGAAAARNLAIENAKGEYIAFIDSDDISFPERFEKQLAFFTKSPETDVLGTTFLEIPEKKIKKRITNPLELKEFIIFKGCPFCQSSVMLKKAILDKNNIRYRPNTIPAEDYALWMDLAEHATFANLEDILVMYRLHENSISKTQSLKQMEMCNRITVQKWKSYFGLNERQTHILLNAFNFKPIPPQEIKELEEIFKKLALSPKAPAGFAQKYLLKKYKRLVRKSNNKRFIKDLSASSLGDFLKVDLFFKLKILLKIIFMKG